MAQCGYCWFACVFVIDGTAHAGSFGHGCEWSEVIRIQMVGCMEQVSCEVSNLNDSIRMTDPKRLWKRIWFPVKDKAI